PRRPRSSTASSSKSITSMAGTAPSTVPAAPPISTTLLITATSRRRSSPRPATPTSRPRPSSASPTTTGTTTSAYISGRPARGPGSSLATADPASRWTRTARTARPRAGLPGIWDATNARQPIPEAVRTSETSESSALPRARSRGRGRPSRAGLRLPRLGDDTRRHQLGQPARRNPRGESTSQSRSPRLCDGQPQHPHGAPGHRQIRDLRLHLQRQEHRPPRLLRLGHAKTNRRRQASDARRERAERVGRDAGPRCVGNLRDHRDYSRSLYREAPKRRYR